MSALELVDAAHAMLSRRVIPGEPGRIDEEVALLSCRDQAAIDHAKTIFQIEATA